VSAESLVETNGELSKLVTVAEERATKRCKQKEVEENKECRERKQTVGNAGREYRKKQKTDRSESYSGGELRKHALRLRMVSGSDTTDHVQVNRRL
jgi:hypothetical protein